MGDIKNEECREKFYKDLPPNIQDYLRDRQLDLVIVTTENDEDIEELFSRLNNGVPLNGAEKRNALGGKYVELIRDIAQDAKFFRHNIDVNNRRYAHYEIVAKLILTEHAGHVTDLKKKFLDKAAVDLRDMPDKYCTQLRESVMARLNSLSKIFGKKDPLLSKQAYVPLYYLFERRMYREYAIENHHEVMKKHIEEIEKARRINMQKDSEEADPELTEYSRRMQQGTNDLGSIEWRLEVLVRRLLQNNPKCEPKDPKRDFNADERYVIWINANKTCGKCGKKIDSFGEAQAHHIKPHAKGGKTVLSNGLCLCGPCHSEVHKE